MVAGDKPCYGTVQGVNVQVGGQLPVQDHPKLAVLSAGPVLSLSVEVCDRAAGSVSSRESLSVIHVLGSVLINDAA